MIRILVIDDNETLASGLCLLFERMGHESISVQSGSAGISILEEDQIDIVITDYRMDEMDGLEVLRIIKKRWPEIDVMVMTAFGSIEIAVEAMKIGAVDFISKPFPHDELRIKVEKVLSFRCTRLENTRLDDENRYLRDEISGRYNFGEIVGNSLAINSVLEAVKKVSQTDSSVLIYGESGTGKELVARALHNQSARRKGPFVKVNCGAIPDELVESELFGHEKGSFTGAIRQRKGKFELAEKGTIFLDEIGDIPLQMQVKLLRVLQEREFDRVGGESTVQSDVRIVAATNRSLREMVADGRFREDLYYRLDVIPIQLPTLREREEDIPLLVAHFMEKKCREMNLSKKTFHEEAIEVIKKYHWPGNVRELENVVERILVMSDGNQIGLTDLPMLLGSVRSQTGAKTIDLSSGVEGIGNGSLNEQMEHIERELIVRAMKKSDGNKTHAADLLGIKTSALYYKLDKFGMA